jgi:molybdate transport system substrate-binding protein
VETDGEMVSELVAEGKVELGLIVIPNIMSVADAELVGPLPAEINSIVMFTAGISAQSANQAAAGSDQAASRVPRPSRSSRPRATIRHRS